MISKADPEPLTQGCIEFSVVIPAYNEERRLGASLDAISAYLARLRVPAELIVVDDGSTDSTAALVERFAAGRADVRLLRHESNLGKGAAVRTGILAARGRYVLFTDADLSTPIDTAGEMLVYLSNGSDVVVGNRRMSESRLDVRQPWLREFLGRVFTRMTRAMLRSDVTDQTCGFKGFKRFAAREIFSRQRIWDWAFDAEILHIAARRGHRVKQIPVRWHDEEGSKVRVLSAGIKSALSLLRIWFNGVKGLYN